MSITIEQLARMLTSHAPRDEWVAFEVETRRIERTGGARPSQSESTERQLGAWVFRDSDTGRGAARLVLGNGGDAAVLTAIERAFDQARLAIGPPWQLPPPAAPARVEVADAAIADDPGGAVDRVMADLARIAGSSSGGRVASARVAGQVQKRRVRTRRGFDRTYRATELRFDIALAPASGGELEPLGGAVRRASDLGLEAHLTRAAERQRIRGQASALEAGLGDLVLTPEAIALPGHGWFGPLAAQASAVWSRHGISRYRSGQPVFDDAERAGGDPITLTSDGTIPFAPQSAPFGALGEPVRRFDLIRAGVAAGLAMDLRDAALAGVIPNGGVRNLVLAPGTTPAAALQTPAERPLVTVHEIAWLDADPRTGDFTAAIALATHQPPDQAPRPTRGGLLIGNLFHLLARARLSHELATHSWYTGPAAIRIDRVTLRS
jgi:predicted Zn-dependent protease